MIPQPYAIAVSLLIGLAVGWTTNGWRMSAQFDRHKAEIAQAYAERLNAIEAEREALQARVTEIDITAQQEAEKHAQEIDRLRADVDAARVRLRVRATCPPVAGVPQSPSNTGVDHAAGPELDPAARLDYFALRRGLGDQHRQLTACQDILRAITDAGSP